MSMEVFFRDKQSDERTFHEVRIASSQSVTTIVDSILHDMAVLDSKSAALLQFISVVLAALTFGLGIVDQSAAFAHILRAGIFTFMVVFGLAAWIDLGCLRSMGPSRVIHLRSHDEFESEMLLEIATRREKYLLALRITEVTFSLLAAFVTLWFLVTHGVRLFF